MTTPQPATPGSDSVRAQIAAALTDDVIVPIERGPILNVLVPLVDDLRAAELDDFAAELIRSGHASAPVLTLLRDRAAAYRTPNPSKETDRG